MVDETNGASDVTGQSAETVGAERKTAKPKAAVETVEMEDGRKVDFVGKRKMLKDSIFVDGKWVGTRFDFKDGRSLTYDAPEETFNFSNSNNALHQFAAHGAEQKLGDATAGEESIGDMYESVHDLIARLGEGEWAMERAGGSFGGTSILIRALMEYRAKPIEEIRVFLKGKSKEAKQAMRNSDRLRPIVQRLEAEEAAKTAHVDTDKLFDELDQAAAA